LKDFVVSRSVWSVGIGVNESNTCWSKDQRYIRQKRRRQPNGAEVKRAGRMPALQGNGAIVSSISHRGHVAQRDANLEDSTKQDRR